MTFAWFLVAALLLGCPAPAGAGTTKIDLATATGVPGTSGTATLPGPCYCQAPVAFSPVLLQAPGTYDFGTVTDYWVLSGGAPDGGPDQDNLWLLYSPVELTGRYPDDFPPLPTYLFPRYALCGQDAAACNGRYDGTGDDFRLVLTLDAGADAIQIGLVGPYLYTSPLPEPLPVAMLLSGLGLVGLRAMWRRRRPGTAAASR